MLEFDSVSVSSYEASSLAGKLTERSADGWEVVAIVPAGSDVTAFLRREAAASGPADETADIGASAAIPAEPVTDAVTDTAADTAPEPAVSEPTVSEPAGWGEAPASTAPTADSGWGTSSTTTPTDTASGWGAGAATADSSWGAGSTDSAPAATVPAAAPQPAPAPAPTPTVPAGWYADPSGRYELRYWDGSAWTEHVARAGQQYTDPPVA